MQRSAYFQLAAIEDHHWWFAYRRKLLAQMIDASGGVQAQSVLDIGCGTGGNLPFLRTYGASVIGLDLSDEAIGLARKKFPDADFRTGDVNDLCRLFPAESFDLITDFNVLYHAWVKSDLESMRDIHRLLRPGGVLISTEPAFNFLWRAHDVIDQGARRYTLGQLRGMLERAGYCSVRGTYFNLPAFPVAASFALVDRLGFFPIRSNEGVRELQPPPQWLNNLVGAVLDIELGAIRLLGGLPLGVSIACIARKPLT